MPKAAGKDKEMDGVEKAAILLIALGPEKSAQIFKHLKEDEIEQLTLEIANTSSVSPQTKEMVLNEFYEVCLAQQYIAEGGISYAKELLEKALGEDKAKDVISKLTASLQVLFHPQTENNWSPGHIHGMYNRHRYSQLEGPFYMSIIPKEHSDRQPKEDEAREKDSNEK